MELKLCPFCGGEAEIKEELRNEIRVRCKECHTQHLNPDAVNTWNTRADEWISVKEVNESN